MTGPIMTTVSGLEPIVEGTKVHIISARHVNESCKKLYLDKVGVVHHYWPGNKYGEYNVYVGDYNNVFDRNELRPVFPYKQ